MILTKIIAIATIAFSLNAYANDDIDANTSAPEMTPYVVGGVNGKSLELPWQVYLEIDKNGSLFACGGTLVTNSWVVTAAHCLNRLGSGEGFSPVNANKITVYSGGIDRTVNGDLSRNVVIKVIASPDYDQISNTGDIALLQLSSSVAAPAQAIKLMDRYLQQKYADIEFDNEVQDNLILSGWGRTSEDGLKTTHILKKVALTGISDSSCRLAWSWPKSIETFICANAYNRGSCNGDSGGPLIWQDKSAASDNDLGYRLAGVVSFGNSLQCALNSLPDVYTQVSSYNTWIKTEIGNYQEPDPYFTQDIFVIDENPLPIAGEGGGVGSSFLLMLIGLLLLRKKNEGLL